MGANFYCRKNELRAPFVPNITLERAEGYAVTNFYNVNNPDDLHVDFFTVKQLDITVNNKEYNGTHLDSNLTSLLLDAHSFKSNVKSIDFRSLNIPYNSEMEVYMRYRSGMACDTREMNFAYGSGEFNLAFTPGQMMYGKDGIEEIDHD